MLESIPLDKILFFDIETVSNAKNYDLLSPGFQDLWNKKSTFFTRYKAEEWSVELASSLYSEKAGIYAEFGKVIVISGGFFAQNEKGNMDFRIKSYHAESERDLLENFSKLLRGYFFNPNIHYLCGHNIREFDIPYLCRRMLINGIKLPAMLDISGKKPWEVKYILDTLELWKFGDYKNYTSLNLLAEIMQVPSPKDDIDGSDVGKIYWEDHDTERIARYCEKDVLTVAQLLLKFRGQSLLTPDQITFVNA
jgi:DNA polymerase elongation subunit (family B)